MFKVKREEKTRRCFVEISESRHSPLVLVGAPAQGCSSPLIRARIKCSLWVDSSTLRHGESPTTTRNLSWVIHKLCWMITKLSNHHQAVQVMTITKSNKHELSLDHDKPNEKGGCTVSFCFYLVIIVPLLTNQAQNVRLAKYNQTVQLVFDFVNIQYSMHIPQI